MEASELLRASLLDAIIPHDTVTDISELLQTQVENQNESGMLLAVKERDLLFFDERIRTLAVLRLPYCSEDTLESHLSRLSFKIDVWAVDESPQNDENPSSASSPKDLVFSKENIQKSEPIVLASESSDRGQTLTLIWEVEVALNRPKFRFPQPVIICIPSATVSIPQHAQDDETGDLAAFQPLEANLLEPMRFIPRFQDDPPYLAASRLERVLPVPTAHKQRIHLSHVPSRRHRAVPATLARIRYQKLGALQPISSTVALLDMDIIPFVHIEAEIEEVTLLLRNGKTEPLMPGFLPMRCRSGDSVTFVHKLYQAVDSHIPSGLGLTNPNIDVLSISIRVNIELSKSCRPVLLMAWTTHVDFTQALNPSFGPPTQPIQRPNRPTSLPITAGNEVHLTGTAMTTPSFQSTFDVSVRSGLSISFTTPGTLAQVGKPIVWKVLVMNHSPRSAKVAVIPLPRVQRQTTPAQSFAKRHAPKSSTASFHPSERRHAKNGEEIDIAQAIVDENVVYAMQHSNVTPPDTDLLALTAELRIGPLAPGQCHESEIHLVAFESGSLRLDAMRVVDLVREAEEGAGATGVLVDIRDLPDVVVAKSKS